MALGPPMDSAVILRPHPAWVRTSRFWEERTPMEPTPESAAVGVTLICAGWALGVTLTTRMGLVGSSLTMLMTQFWGPRTRAVKQTWTSTWASWERVRGRLGAWMTQGPEATLMAV